MAVLYPDQGDFAEVYRALEDLAGDPRQIQTTTDGPTLGLVVSDELFDRYMAISEEETEAPKRRPGRPRKSQES